MIKSKCSLSLILLLFVAFGLVGQDFCNESFPLAQESLHSNRVSGTISTGGDLFMEEPFRNIGFGFHEDETTVHHTVYVGTLVMSGINAEGEFQEVYQTYERAGSYFTYIAGPLVEGVSDSITRCNWDRIWQVSAENIYLHRQEFALNGTPAVRRREIYDYPAKGNPYFTDYNDFSLPIDSELAPFFDKNGDEIYNPDNGDFPLPRGVDPTAVPPVLYWSIFNDGGINRDLHGEPLGMEVALTAFAYECSSEPVVNRTLFTHYAITNKGERLDSFRVGTYFNMNIGHYNDDHFGTAPELNTIYAYNSEPEDELGSISFPYIPGTNLPVQSMTYLNCSLDHSILHWETAFSCCYSGMIGPYNARELHHNMSGRWIDEIPLTRGGNGRNDSDTIAAHYFPDNPNAPSGWSAEFLPDMDMRGIASHRKEQFTTDEIIYLDKAWTYHQAENGDHLSNVNYMYEQIPRLQEYYDSGFANLPCLVSNTGNADNHNVINVFPNPTSGTIQIDIANLKLKETRILNSQGMLVFQGNQTQIDLSTQPAGVYFMMIEMESGRFFFFFFIKL
ncbi:MAG: T9SS type A sorting domain-containing protein [Saprospiraceae bacterium]